MQDNNNADFLLLLAFSKGFKEIEEQSGYSIIRQDNDYCLFEPNTLKPFAKIPIDTLIKEFYNEQQPNRTTKESATIKQETNTLYARVGRYADNVFERVRGMVQERDNQAKERSRRSRGESAESRGLSRQDRGLSQTDNTIRYLLREQILTQQSTIDDRLKLKSLHTQYQNLKDEANKARAIKTYLELGGIANDEVLEKFAKIPKTTNTTNNNTKNNKSHTNSNNIQTATKTKSRRR